MARSPSKECLAATQFDLEGLTSLKAVYSSCLGRLSRVECEKCQTAVGWRGVGGVDGGSATALGSRKAFFWSTRQGQEGQGSSSLSEAERLFDIEQLECGDFEGGSSGNPATWVVDARVMIS
jgi:hypothetical protein